MTWEEERVGRRLVARRRKTLSVIKVDWVNHHHTAAIVNDYVGGPSWVVWSPSHCCTQRNMGQCTNCSIVPEQWKDDWQPDRCDTMVRVSVHCVWSVYPGRWVQRRRAACWDCCERCRCTCPSHSTEQPRSCVTQSVSHGGARACWQHVDTTKRLQSPKQ